MEQKDKYTLRELFDNLEITMTELSQMSKISDVTLGRVYKGHSVRRKTINILLRTFSEIYGLKFSQKNVDGIIIQGKPVNIPTTSTYSRESSEDIPDDLPFGSVSCKVFFLSHHISDTSWRRWIENGLQGERFDFEERERAGSRKEKFFFTPAQQEKALDLLRRHSKLKIAESDEENIAMNSTTEEL